jgi:hypothetical protein
MRIKQSFLIFAVFVLAVVSRAQEAVYRYETGKEYRYKFTFTEAQVQEMSGEAISSSRQATVFATYRVAEVLANGARKGTWTLDTAKVTEVSDDGEPRVTDKEMAGSILACTMDIKGKVAEIDSPACMAHGIAADLLVSVANSLPGLDVTKMKAGEKWALDTTSATGDGTPTNTMTQKQKSEYDVRGMEDSAGHPYLKVSMVGIIGMEGKTTQSGTVVSITGDGSVKSTVSYDAAAGVLLHAVLDISLDTIAVIGGDQRMPLSSTSTTEIEYFP